MITSPKTLKHRTISRPIDLCEERCSLDRACFSRAISCRSRLGADYLHQPCANHQHGESFYCTGTSSHCSAAPSDDLAVTADLVVQFDELSEWLCALIDQKQRFCRHRNVGGINFVARFQLQAPPAVMARGMLGMLRYDATAVVKNINVPALVLPGIEIECKPEASERMHRDIPDHNGLVWYQLNTWV